MSKAFLFVSGEDAAKQQGLVGSKGITHIINCAGPQCPNYLEYVREILQQYIPCLGVEPVGSGQKLARYIHQGLYVHVVAVFDLGFCLLLVYVLRNGHNTPTPPRLIKVLLVYFCLLCHSVRLISCLLTV